MQTTAMIGCVEFRDCLNRVIELPFPATDTEEDGPMPTPLARLRDTYARGIRMAVHPQTDVARLYNSLVALDDGVDPVANIAAQAGAVFVVTNEDVNYNNLVACLSAVSSGAVSPSLKLANFWILMRAATAFFRVVPAVDVGGGGPPTADRLLLSHGLRLATWFYRWLDAIVGVSICCASIYCDHLSAHLRSVLRCYGRFADYFLLYAYVTVDATRHGKLVRLLESEYARSSVDWAVSKGKGNRTAWADDTERRQMVDTFTVERDCFETFIRRLFDLLAEPEGRRRQQAVVSEVSVEIERMYGLLCATTANELYAFTVDYAQGAHEVNNFYQFTVAAFLSSAPTIPLSVRCAVAKTRLAYLVPAEISRMDPYAYGLFRLVWSQLGSTPLTDRREALFAIYWAFSERAAYIRSSVDDLVEQLPITVPIIDERLAAIEIAALHTLAEEIYSYRHHGA